MMGEGEDTRPLPFGKRPAAGIGSWRMRRAFMFGVTAFCMGVVAYILMNDVKGRVAETCVTMAFFTLMMVTGSYVFGAVWQDVSTIRSTGFGGGQTGGHVRMRSSQQYETDGPI